METSVNARDMPPKSRRSPWLVRLSVIALIGIGVLFMLGRVRPDLGVSDGHLVACPDSPNCVSTQADIDSQRIEPLRMLGNSESDIEKVTLIAREAILSMPRTRFVVQEPDYCHVECTSLIFRFVDDLEIWIDVDNKLVHARSASRVGYSDMGTNRKRVEQIFAKLIDAGVAFED